MRRTCISRRAKPPINHFDTLVLWCYILLAEVVPMVQTFRKRSGVVRLNIYLPDPALRRLVKGAAARQDLSVSEYCVRAITNQLDRDQEGTAAQGKHLPLSTAVGSARRFQAETFHGRIFKVRSAELIRQAREQRPT